MLGPNLVPNPGAETNTTGWSGGNCTVARVTTPVRTGSGAFSVTATSTANANMLITPNLAVSPGVRYTITGYVRSAATSRSCFVVVDWATLPSGGAYVSTSASSGTASTTSGFTLITATVTAPATAFGATFYPQITAPVASEIHYWDDISFQQNIVYRRIGNYR